MLPARQIQSAAHAMSQLVYLDAVPAMERDGVVTVGALADYYSETPVGQAYLEARFGGIEREYTLWREFLGEGVSPWRDWAIVDVLSDNAPRQSGFYGCTYRSPGGGRVVAFRGSENLGNPLYKNDYITDFALAYKVPTPQQAMAGLYLRRYGAGGPFTLTGHSLGGNLALYGAVTLKEELRREMTECLAFNAPGFNGEFLERYHDALESIGERLFCFQNEFDLVSSLLKDAVPPLMIASRFDPGERPQLPDLLYPHSNFMFRREQDGAFVLAEGGKSPLCRLVNHLTGLFLALPAPVRREISGVTLNALYAPPTPENTKRYMLEAVIKHLSHNEGLLREHTTGIGALYGAGMLSDFNVHDLVAALRGSESVATPELARALLILTEMLHSRIANRE